MVEPPPRIGIQLMYTDDTGTNLTDRDRLCFTCCTTDERTSRKSNLVRENSLVKKSSLFERTRSRSRLEQFLQKRGPLSSSTLFSRPAETAGSGEQSLVAFPSAL
ncbi:hypothetical protein K438DRAFT_2012036 [Mycena galopus ATCC 62051]|nr:hypothetical protein K438DRAFT_2012036 [Mycena galopus ATCC 62051]